MADVNPQDIMKLLQQSATSQKSYADKLRETREARQAELSKFADQTGSTNDFQTPGGVPLNPADVINAKSLFARSLSNAIEPYSPELEQKARVSEADILTQIYQLSQKDKLDNSKAEPTLTEKLKALELGYTIDENGNPVKSSSTDVDKEIIKTWATGLKNGTAKFTDIPEKLQGDVLKEMSSSSTEISKSAEKAVGIISELEKLNTGGITGKARLAWTDKARKAEGLLKQLNSELQIEESKRLKGQGSMSDAERAILANAVSGFNLDENGRSRLSDKDFKAELSKLKTGLSGQGSTSAAYDEDKLLKDMGIGGK